MSGVLRQRCLSEIAEGIKSIGDFSDKQVEALLEQADEKITRLTKKYQNSKTDDVAAAHC